MEVGAYAPGSHQCPGIVGGMFSSRAASEGYPCTGLEPWSLVPSQVLGFLSLSPSQAQGHNPHSLAVVGLFATCQRCHRSVLHPSSPVCATGAWSRHVKT